MRLTNSDNRIRSYGRFLFLLMLPILFLLCTGCGNKTDDQKSSQAHSKTKSECSIAIDTSAWELFCNLGDRATAGKDVSTQEFADFGRQPSVALWLESNESMSMSYTRLGSWVELTFAEELGRTGEGRIGSTAKSMVELYRFSYDSADKIDKFIADYISNQGRCRLIELAQKWISPENIPPSLTIHFLPGKSDIHLVEDNLIVDTGAAVSSSPDQMNRNLVALMYDEYQAIAGGNPVDLFGSQAIANSLRTLCNQGISSWISDMPNNFFYQDHPTLGNINIIPEDIFFKGRKVVGMLDRNISNILLGKNELHPLGNELALHLNATKSFQRGGYTMAATIAGNLGEEKLLEVRGSVSEFVSAYQKAALMNPSPLPVPGQAGISNYQTMPPLAPDVYEWLIDMLVKEGF